jgi:hypothetical protein
MGQTYEQFVESERSHIRARLLENWRVYQDETGSNRLAKARRLIDKGGKRKLKRAIRLHREVYGMFFSPARISMQITAAEIRRGQKQWLRAIHATHHAANAFLKIGQTLQRLSKERSRHFSVPAVDFVVGDEIDIDPSLDEDPAAYIGDERIPVFQSQVDGALNEAGIKVTTVHAGDPPPDKAGSR